jgi:hypothetical protein
MNGANLGSMGIKLSTKLFNMWQAFTTWPHSLSTCMPEMDNLQPPKPQGYDNQGCKKALVWHLVTLQCVQRQENSIMI